MRLNQGGHEHGDQRRVLIIAYDDAQILDIACPSGALDVANRYGAQPPYAIELGTLGRRAAGVRPGFCWQPVGVWRRSWDGWTH
ncbi:hypothetical protein QBA36_41315 [Streptomyces stelliscabiei]